jgi:hypothetical protein
MIAFANPWWLLGIAVLPLLRALHRRGRPTQATVSALFIWPQTDSQPDGRMRQDRPEPRWRRRALLVSLLLVALAGIGWHTPRSSVPVQVELIPGMSWRTMEADGQSRAEHAAAALAAALANSGHPPAVLTPLDGETRPMPITGLGVSELARRIGALDNAASIVAAPISTGEARRWLLADGTRAAALGAAALGYEQVIGVGTGTENSGIAALSLRRAADGRMQGSVQVYNAGRALAQRRVVVRAGDVPIGDWRVKIPPEQAEAMVFDVPGGASAAATLSARISPADALTSDDALRLDAAPLTPLPTRVGPDCPAALVAAAAANPRLALASAEADAALLLHCAAAPPSADGAAVVIWFQAEAPASSTRAVPLGSLPPELRRRYAMSAPPRATPLAAGRAETGPLAGSAAAPLVRALPEAQRIDCGLALTGVTAGLPALLLDWLLDQVPRAFPRSNLVAHVGSAGPITAAIPIEQMRIAPGPLPSPDADAGARMQQQPHDGPRLAALIAALLLLLPELGRFSKPAFSSAAPG